MEAYGVAVETAMRRLFESLSEKDRRRYAAVEALKLGHGGLGYVATVMGCDPKTVRQGEAELAELPADPADGRVRKKGVDAGRRAGPGLPSRAVPRAAMRSAATAGLSPTSPTLAPPPTRSTRRS